MNMPTARNEGTYGQRLMKWLDPIRESRGLTDMALGALAGISPSNLSRWRSTRDLGRVGLPTLTQLRAVADALDLSLLTMLDVMGLLSRDEKAGIERVEATAPPSIDDAIERDPTLSAQDREIFRLLRGRGPGRVRNRGRRN